MSEKLFRIGLTHGDYNGIGYEVMLKTLIDDRTLELYIPIIYGTKKLCDYYQDKLDLGLSAPIEVIKSPLDARPGVISLIDVSPDKNSKYEITPGHPSEDSARLAVSALFEARKDLDAGDLDGVVTAPIHKDTAHKVVLPDGSGVFPCGQTEFFASTHPDENALMLFSDRQGLRVGLLTIHLPLADVPGQITRIGIINAARRLEKAIKIDYGIEKPRIALMGLNPHAGENGLIGLEEEEVLKPAVSDLWETGMLIFGPYPADGFWGSGSWSKFDAILSLYHDQGLVPFKMRAMNEGVNVTTGLSVVRTSPDHGTAFDIAGKGVADPGSFRAAVYEAIDIIRQRHIHAENTSNPLVIHSSQKRREGRDFD